MPHDALAIALDGALASLGLDVQRYTPALVKDFLARFPEPQGWQGKGAHAELIATFAIGETTFLRHPEHFACLRTLLPALSRERAGKPLRAFSAGCASGEEAYSLASVLASQREQPFSLLAWDVNPEAIARAKLGEYRPWSLRDVAEDDTRGWLQPSPSGVRVEDWLRHKLSFEVGNLHADNYPRDLDIVFCRNVLLYFRPEAARAVFARIADALRPGGVLFIGHYDPRPPLESNLVLERVGHTHFYRKLEPSERSKKSSSIVEPANLQYALPKVNMDSEETRMEVARLLVNQQRHADALMLLERLGKKRALSPEFHVLTALAAEDSGDTRLMLEAARRACFLAPDEPGPNYFLSVAFMHNGELRRADVHRRIAANGLRSAARTSDVLRFSEGLTVGQLRRLLGALGR
jgi:chemotaxis protein methyltransferase CheR